MTGHELTPAQTRWQARFEGLIGLAAPFLDAMLAVGDRVSRMSEPDDSGYYPVRRGAEGSFLGNATGAGERGRSIGSAPPASD